MYCMWILISQHVTLLHCKSPPVEYISVTVGFNNTILSFALVVSVCGSLQFSDNGCCWPVSGVTLKQFRADGLGLLRKRSNRCRSWWPPQCSSFLLWLLAPCDAAGRCGREDIGTRCSCWPRWVAPGASWQRKGDRALSSGIWVSVQNDKESYINSQ